MQLSESGPDASVDLFDARDDDRSDDETDDDNGGNKFKTLWPILMVLLTILIFAVVVGVVCRHRLQRCLQQNSDEQNDTRRTAGGISPPGRATPVPQVGLNMGDDPVPQTVFSLKPPPYCAKPPSYDEISVGPDTYKLDSCNVIIETGEIDGTQSEGHSSTSRNTPLARIHGCDGSISNVSTSSQGHTSHSDGHRTEVATISSTVLSESYHTSIDYTSIPPPLYQP